MSAISLKQSRSGSCPASRLAGLCVLGVTLLLPFTFLRPIAGEAAAPGVQHRLMLLEYGKGPNRLLELDGNGKVVWEHKPPSLAVIFEVLPNGNVVYAYGGKQTGVREITRKGEEVWNYVSHCPQVLGCSRLKNGNTLVAEQGPCRAVEVNPKRGSGAHHTVEDEHGRLSLAGPKYSQAGQR